MVAVLTVFANHLWDFPSGGFIGVDVFFVISGFLITGNLLRDAETRGTVSFTRFYWNRVRRIVPAATVVLILTYLAAVLVFLPFRAREVGVDALFAFFFTANWHFAIQDTDYFAATSQAISPIQHYWSLSIEEQFYFVWPALIFVISLLVIRKAWTHEHRMRLTGGVMGVIVAMSLGWALYETAVSAAWAYFNTFARVWELGVGALLATMVGGLARIPEMVKPALSWAGLGLIGASLFLIADDSVGFPAPWALLPVVGTALVIAAGVGAEPKYQAFLRNPISGYVGNISYSLYLVHWPVIVILGTLMDSGVHLYVAVLALAFGLAIMSYHLVENPMRRADWRKLRETAHEIRRGRYRPQRSSDYAAVGALILLTVTLSAYVMRPEAYEQSSPPPMAAAAPAELNPSAADPAMGPLASDLQNEIIDALQAAEWPALDPPMESVIDGPEFEPEVDVCSGEAFPDEKRCTWGSPSAPTKVVLVGDSIALSYAGPLREIALNSGGQIQVHTQAAVACAFANDVIERKSLTPRCIEKKQHAVDVINTSKPDVVIVSNSYLPSRVVGSQRGMTPDEWSDSIRQIAEKFSGTAGRVVLMAPPPAEAEISECYGDRSSTPADCITTVTTQWQQIAIAEQDVAAAIGGTWVDSRPWFCSSARLCPSFVGSTPTKQDMTHIAPSYGKKIYPVMAESLKQAGVF